MTLYDLPAPAKLNLFLHVVGRREDGYHLLQSVFRLITLADSVSLELRTDGRVSREGGPRDLAEQDDLVVRAATSLQRLTGCRLGVHIQLTKRIPIGGGLGGGSSDAATVLLGLNRLWRLGLSRSELMKVGLVLGADVPFFLFGKMAFVQGVGERLTPVDLLDCSYLIFKPPVCVPTGAIFKDPDLTRDTETVKISDFSGRESFVEQSFGRNDLEPVAQRLHPAICEAMNWVASEGLKPRLTGSGSCFFSECIDPAHAELARAVLVGKMHKGRVSANLARPLMIEHVYACDGMCEHPLRYWVND
jgi:4-diphosphocytidyl-2-C-methyl-D-erythritol kinase